MLGAISVGAAGAVRSAPPLCAGRVSCCSVRSVPFVGRGVHSACPFTLVATVGPLHPLRPFHPLCVGHLARRQGRPVRQLPPLLPLLRTHSL
eukprot:2099548-Pleurochrysis_carterae.AAC.1